MKGRLDLRLLLGAFLALSASACIAGPQPEPPDTPDDDRAGVTGRGANGNWLWPSADEPDDDGAPPPPMPPGAYADAGPSAPDAGAAQSPDPGVPWLDGDGEAGGFDGTVAPFPFEPCCGWFTLPGDAGPDSGR